MKKSLFAIVLGFNLLLAMSSSVYALDANKISDSKFIFSRNTSAQIHWIMVNVTKDDRKEQILLPVEDGHVSANIYLRSGPGIYSIQVSETSSVEKYSSYVVKQSLTIENTDYRDMSFLLPSDQVQSDNEEIIALAKTITAGAVDEFDAVKKIHLYVAKNIKYDYPSYYDGTYATKNYDAVSTLSRLSAVCAGYANLYAALGRAVGIRVKVIYGVGYTSKTTSGDHAWNEVFVNNEWKSVDATWDSTTGRMLKYFNISEEAFEQDHQKQTETSL